jgi:hypothetical protein
MNISDLTYLEQVNQENNVVGGYYGGDDFDVTTIQKQVSDINQYASSASKATAQFGGAFADSDAANIANLAQWIG